MEALLTIDENWRPTSDGWVSSPWAPIGGPTKYIIYNILINQKTGLGPWGRWAVGFEIINKKHILFFGLLKTFFERVHLSERLQTFKKVAY